MLTNYISVHLNGRPFNCSPDLSLEDLLNYLAFDLSSVIVEHNREIIQGLSYSNVFVMPGDKIEVLTIVGGG
jgi:sulfur carrier protein